MNNLALTIAMGMAVCIALITKGIYNYCGWKWKVRPWMPLCWGFLLLSLSVWLSWHLDQAIYLDQKMLEQARQVDNTDAVAAIAATLQGQQWQLKLIELIGIPLAVSLLVTAFTLKVDKEYGITLLELEECRNELATQQQAIEFVKQEFSQALEGGLLGGGLLKRRDDLTTRQLEQLDRVWDVLDKFEPLIKSKMVKDLDDQLR